ncbi:hypothetical protein [Niabella sp.]|uniref:hypothetical protein n=1 Tax=Niabella sp. TaxID=1962976 RepID=UPI00261B2ABB|nr:hypothetical protein [Niabella sp.]
MKRLLIIAATTTLFFSCKRDGAIEEKAPTAASGVTVHLVAEYKPVSYTRAYGMHPLGGGNETADKPFGKGYGLVQLFSKEEGGTVSSAFVVMINNDGGTCGQDTVAVKPLTPDTFELLSNKIGSCTLSSRAYIRISPVDNQTRNVIVGQNALISYDPPSAGVVDWVYHDYQTVVRTK